MKKNLILRAFLLIFLSGNLSFVCGVDLSEYIPLESNRAVSDLVVQNVGSSLKNDIECARVLAKLGYNKFLKEQEGYYPKLKNIKTFTGKTGLFSSSPSHCGFVAEEGEKFIVSIRGTESLSDLGTNINTGIWDGVQDQHLLGISGQVHSGFYHYGKSIFENIWPDLLERINKRLVGKQTCIDILKKVNFQIQGHSLGGAGAHIVALMIKKALKDKIAQIDRTSNFDPGVKLVTFESPRVCNKDAALQFDEFIGKEKHIRVIQKDPSGYILHTDPVTALSFGALGFKHTGTLVIHELETAEARKSADIILHSMAPITADSKCYKYLKLF